MTGSDPQQELTLLDGPEDMRLYEYSVLVTNLEDEIDGDDEHHELAFATSRD